ncbi:TPA: hypothetical protein SAN82_001266 [Pseudomonas putida]|nr:hypothetical protein [Pseudomonas putida]
MKHSAIAGLFITAALLASPVFAADENLCDVNIQKIKDALTTAPALASNAELKVEDTLEKAEAAKASNNQKDCIELTSGLLTRIQVANPAKK